MTEEERKGYIGNPGQLYTLRRMTVEEGKARGTRIIEVVTAGGLHLDILPDSGLDLGRALYRGTNVSWLCKNGYDSPASFLPYESNFLNTFPGGLLYTCGLRSAGPSNRDGDEYHPLHGRYHGTPAEQVCAFTEGDEIVVSGTVRETALFGHVLELKRVIRIPVYGSEVTVEDALTNLSPRDEEYMMIYHCNFGWPLLSEKAKLILPDERETVPRTGFAADGLDRQCEFDTPVDGEEERVFFQKMKTDFSAGLVNEERNISMRMTWSGDTLPILSEWRSMASGDYVLGLEPTNCYIMGRSEERKNGTLPVLRAFETVKHKVTIAFSEIKA